MKIQERLGDICRQIAESTGSIEFIRTYGTSILRDQGDYWSEHGTLHFEDIYNGLQTIRRMIIHYDDYDDSPKQFMYDVFGILNDTSFHCAIVSIYLMEMEQFARERGLVSGNILDKMQESQKGDATINTDKIASGWEWDEAIDKKTDVIVQILKATGVCIFIIEYMFSSESTEEQSLTAVGDLILCLFSLQTLYYSTKRDWKDSRQR